ncbi:toll-like receptor 2 [Petromyzon marinus]|uniref:toll-like receptor 2 n=1 Tax=Petromyzon marinus TaxID=7757 RepID=UPI003F713E53
MAFKVKLARRMLMCTPVILCLMGFIKASLREMNDPASHCHIKDEGRTADCSHRGLTHVPRGLSADITRLDLSYNNIKALEVGDFSSTPNLQVLTLAFNHIQKIHPQAMATLKRLYYLDLCQNNLSEKPGEALGSLPNLQVLNISMNNYTSFALGVDFSRMSNLRDLTIGTSKTTTLNASDFQALESVPLKYLNLNTGSPLWVYETGALTHLRSLEKLNTNVSVDKDPLVLSKMLTDLNNTNISELEIFRILNNPLKNASIDFFKGLGSSNLLKNMTLIEANFTDKEVSNLLKNIYLSELTMLVFKNSSYTDHYPVIFNGVKNVTKRSSLKKIVIDSIFHLNMTYPIFIVNMTLFPNISQLKISNTGMNKVDCFFMKMKAIKQLDFSRNLLNEGGLWWDSCNYTVILPEATELIISHNYFKDLKKISEMVSLMPRINSLDVSYNGINYIEECRWPSSLERLILRNNEISKESVICTSANLKFLDLSYTRLESFPNYILTNATSLQELHLTGNLIKYISSDVKSQSLQVLYVDYNAVGIIGQGTFQHLQKIKSITLGNNPFYCMCDLYWFRQRFNKTLLNGWPNDYTCSYPEYLSGKEMDYFNPNILNCDRIIAISVSVVVTVVVIALVIGIGHYFDAIWYIRMGFIWVSAKRRRYKIISGEEDLPFQYHAFISYSHLDSEWVQNTLVPTLEHSNPDLRLCIHERDFTPGHWIVDNIIQCIEKSSKTLFVLSRNFVNSEWCHYELYFAQHRMVEENQDSLVLLLLEPLPKGSLPSKFCKLRRLLSNKTYLEWPTEERKRAVFWTSLNAVLQSRPPPHSDLGS